MPMLSYRFWSRSNSARRGALLLSASLAALPGFVLAQSPPPPTQTNLKSTQQKYSPPAPVTAPTGTAQAMAPVKGSDIVHFTTTIGSFKVLGSDVTPVQGTMTMNFNGTVLVSGLEKGGKVTPSGTVKMEKQTRDGKRQVYFGKGRLVVVGKMRSFQFFGKELSGTFQGAGIFRLYGEFDKKLETGFIWYDGEEKRPWGTGGMQIVVPNQQATSQTAKVKVHPAGQ